MKPSRRATFAISIVMVLLLGEAASFAAHMCCQNTQSYPGCFGCVQVSDDPAEFLQVGVNTVSKCVSAHPPLNCNESSTKCYALFRVPLYLDENCSVVIGTASLSKSVGQCDGTDDVCGGAG